MREAKRDRACRVEPSDLFRGKRKVGDRQVVSELVSGSRAENGQHASRQHPAERNDRWADAGLIRNRQNGIHDRRLGGV